MAVLKVILANLVIFALLYAAVEIPYSAFQYLTAAGIPATCWLMEHPGETIRFDPDRGFFLTRTPSRFARIVDRHLEIVGTYRGNAQGFADRDDFTVQRSNRYERRFAVFGDSFTAGTFVVPRTWPERLEDTDSAGRGQPLKLLNFAVTGVGLATWASILRNIVVRDEYELDGLIIAVAWDDLDRKFALFDQVDSQTLAYTRAPSWDPALQPKTSSEAASLLKNYAIPDTYILSPSDFDAALAGHWNAPRKWKFRLTTSIAGAVTTGVSRLVYGYHLLTFSGFDSGQIYLIEEIRRLTKEHLLPTVVAYIPSRDELLSPPDSRNLKRTKQFAEMIGASFLDGREAFRGLSSQEIKESWYPHDGHWNQVGSDRFAGFMSRQIESWGNTQSPTTVGGR
jgi:hypothetical protein